MEKSESIVSLAAALCSASGQMGKAVMNSKNPHFKSKYADLESLLDAARVPLGLNGLAVVQMPSQDSLGYYVETMILHTSGEFISGKTYISPSKNDPQGLGSAITYAKRYGFSSMLGLVGEEDDDGNAASAPVSKPAYQSQPTRPAAPAAANMTAPKPAGVITGNSALDALFGGSSPTLPPRVYTNDNSLPLAGGPPPLPAVAKAVASTEASSDYVW
jgi:hypothetical protein